jgi:hypothetical protein
MSPRQGALQRALLAAVLNAGAFACLGGDLEVGVLLAPASPTDGGIQPGAENTGVPTGTVLATHVGDLRVEQAGAVIDGLDVQGGVDIHADGVTLRRTRVQCTGSRAWCIQLASGVRGVRIEDAEVGGGADGITFNASAAGILLSATADSLSPNTVARTHVHHVGDGLSLEGNSTVEASWVHTLARHSSVQAAQSVGGDNLVLRGNTLECGLGGCVLLERIGGGPPIARVLIAGNWLLGTEDGSAKSWTGIATSAGISEIEVVNNRFNRSFELGAGVRGSPWTTWTGNTYVDDGSVVPAP